MVEPDTSFELVDTREAYLDALERLRAGTGPVGVDAERASGYRYFQNAYLIQVYREGSGTFLFDPPALGADLSELGDVLADEEWILHAASQDLACLREVSMDPERIFDTELAARLLGLPRVGLGAVVEELLGIHLAKEHSAADWSTRPLPASWLVYAALDVDLLPRLREAMVDLLEKADKAEIAAQEFQATLDRQPKAALPEPWRRLSGLNTLRGARNLAAARELWHTRDALARERDVSPGRLVPDASLVAAAKALPESKAALAGMREFSGRASRSELDRWWEAIAEARVTEDLPAPRLRSAEPTMPPPRAWADRNPEADARLKHARLALVARAEKLDMPLENLLTPELLRRVAWRPPTVLDSAHIGVALAELGARPWQVDATAEPIAEAFVAALQGPPSVPETDS